MAEIFSTLKYDSKVWVKRMKPCAWFFMKRHRTKDYKEILIALVEEAKKHGLVLSPMYVMVDFELAAKQAFEYVFIDILVRGCLFHFGQTLFKNLIKIGLKQEYLDNEELRNFFKRVFCLALIPLPSVDAECIELQHLIQDIGVRYPNIGIAKAERFWQYFINTFFEGQFPLRMWNHFDNIYERTNNHVEGDNNKMKLFCGAANPNVDKAVHLLQQYETTSSDKYKFKTN